MRGTINGASVYICVTVSLFSPAFAKFDPPAYHSPKPCVIQRPNSPVPRFVLFILLVDLDDLPLGVHLGPKDVGVGRGAHPTDNLQLVNFCTTIDM